MMHEGYECRLVKICDTSQPSPKISACLSYVIPIKDPTPLTKRIDTEEVNAKFWDPMAELDHKTKRRKRCSL